MRLLTATSAFLLATAALTATTHAFVGHNNRPVVLIGAQRRHSATTTSNLRMVADDAKVILVTGSSRGLGKAIALEMGKAGQKVIINYVSEGSQGAAETTVNEIKALGGDAVAIQADSTCF
jgi:short chain dehydrogenase